MLLSSTYKPIVELDYLSGSGHMCYNVINIFIKELQESNRTLTFEPDKTMLGQEGSDIIIRIKQGEKTALEELFKSYYESLCYFANKYIQDIDEAEDVVQEMYFQLWEKREQLHVTTSIKSYLYSAVKNACLNKIKHLKVVHEHQQYETYTANNNEQGVDDQLEYEELKQRIDVVIDELPPERRKVYELSRNEGLKYKEIAEQLNISVKTVENQMGKALKHLRDALQDLAGLTILFFIIKFLM